MSQPANKRIESLKELLGREPENPLIHLMLAAEHLKERQFQTALDTLETYLGLTDDEGSAYRMKAQALLALGRDEEARTAYRQGIAAAQRHHHSSMVSEFEQALEDLR